ncbi:MAG: CpsD/CapB family tyrosine-protein kinase [Candidatus Acidiferrales bacterium]
MSRIHEALKKAEQERAAVHAVEGVVLPADATAATPPRIETEMETRAEIPSRTATMAPAVGNYLRFDDLRQHCAHPHWHMDPNVNVFFNPSLSEHGAEQFRTLRSRLYQLRGGQALRTLLVTSAVPGEGKTFVTSNLAQAIVRQPDRRVLIIDADLRCSRLHVPLGAPSAPGLTDYLRGEADEMKVIQHGQEGNLCFVPGGNEVSNPSELLSNGKLKTLLDRVTPVFDWVILDSPPCLPVADASVLADLVDGVLMVVRAAVTPALTAQRACQELQGRNVVGVVLNAMEETAGYDSYYYSGYGYGYGRGEMKGAHK